jgi:hypothetical protein
MKKLTSRYRNWLRHRQQYCARKRTQTELIILTQPFGPSWRARAARHNLPMPETLCFNANCEESLIVLADLRKWLHVPMRGTRRGHQVSKHRNARIRQAGRYRAFESLKLVTPAAALVLAAEFERAAKIRGITPTIYNIDKWAESVLDTFWDIGFFEIVGFPTGIEKPNLADNFVLLPMRSGDTADGTAIADLIDHLRALYPAVEGEETAPTGLLHLYGAMVEAVVNVCRHAYPQQVRYQYKPLRRWWMTGAVDREKRWTTAVIFDQGVTIPVSLPGWENYAGWQKRITSKLGLSPAPNDFQSDGEAIATAVEEAVSSTGEAHRGHGLAQMREFANKCRAGYLRIMSRCGEVVFFPNDRVEIKSHDISIGGTLIEWNVLL